MIIKKGTPCIFLRISDYGKYNQMQEHIDCCKKNGYVWMLKVGQKPNESYIKEVIKSGGVIITKSTAKYGHKFYCSKILSIVPDDKLIYPDYYNEFMDYNFYDIETLKNDGFWVKVSEFVELSNEKVDKFVTSSTKRSLLECGTKFRVTHMNVEPIEDIKI